MRIADELERGEIREPVADRGFEAGWCGVGRGANPYHQWRKRETWERHRRLGAEAYERYLEVMASKSGEE